MPFTNSYLGLRLPTNSELLGLNSLVGNTFGANILSPDVENFTPSYQDYLDASKIGSDTTQFGFNLPTFQLGLNALTSLGGLYNAFNLNNLANKQYNLQKDVLNTNLNNQIKSYNTALEDQLRARAAMETGNANAYDDQIEQRKLSR